MNFKMSYSYGYLIFDDKLFNIYKCDVEEIKTVEFVICDFLT